MRPTRGVASAASATRLSSPKSDDPNRGISHRDHQTGRSEGDNRFIPGGQGSAPAAAPMGVVGSIGASADDPAASGISHRDHKEYRKVNGCRLLVSAPLFRRCGSFSLLTSSPGPLATVARPLKLGATESPPPTDNEQPSFLFLRTARIRRIFVLFDKYGEAISGSSGNGSFRFVRSTER